MARVSFLAGLKPIPQGAVIETQENDDEGTC